MYETIRKESEPTKSLYAYISKHGVGPGTVPKDIELSFIYDVPNTMQTVFCSNRELTPEELNKYELKPFPNWEDSDLMKNVLTDN